MDDMISVLAKQSAELNRLDGVIERLTAALLTAREDALREAAAKADYWAKNYRLGDSKKSRFGRLDMNRAIWGTARGIEEDILALIPQTTKEG